MSEREMLELAAKAAGYQVTADKMTGWLFLNDRIWNPREDDGDAFRLASRLKFYVSFSLASVEVECWQDECGVTREVIEYFDEPDEATAAARLAITRAAAEVGKAMP